MDVKEVIKTVKKAEEQRKEMKESMRSGLLAAVLIRGMNNMRHDHRQALYALKLRRKNACVVLKDNPVNRGTLNKVKDFVTYGPIGNEVFKKLQQKKPANVKGVSVFSLAPPKGGYGYKGIKTAYQQSGCLGHRSKGMDELIERML